MFEPDSTRKTLLLRELTRQADALAEVQELIAPDNGDPWTDPPLPSPELWERIVAAAFPQPPMAGHDNPDKNPTEGN